MCRELYVFNMDCELVSFNLFNLYIDGKRFGNLKMNFNWSDCLHQFIVSEIRIYFLVILALYCQLVHYIDF